MPVRETTLRLGTVGTSLAPSFRSPYLSAVRKPHRVGERTFNPLGKLSKPIVRSPANRLENRFFRNSSLPSAHGRSAGDEPCAMGDAISDRKSSAEAAGPRAVLTASSGLIRLDDSSTGAAQPLRTPWRGAASVSSSVSVVLPMPSHLGSPASSHCPLVIPQRMHLSRSKSKRCPFSALMLARLVNVRFAVYSLWIGRRHRHHPRGPIASRTAAIASYCAWETYPDAFSADVRPGNPLNLWRPNEIRTRVTA